MLLKIMREIRDMGFRGPVGFHHLSEPFEDSRIIQLADRASNWGMWPYAHTNGDRLRRDPGLCQEAVRAFRRITVGIYDVVDAEGIAEQKAWWLDRLQGTQVAFSCAAHVFPRALNDYDKRMFREKVVTRGACRRPGLRLIINYTGNMGLCCEDMHEEFGLGNAFESHVESLWRSPRHQHVIDDLAAGNREPYALCSRCVLPAQKV
jgi:hypothetical protein